MRREDDGSDLMTMEEVAARLRVTHGTLRNWRSAGIAPPGVRMGKRVMFRRAVVEEWIDVRFQDTSLLSPAATPPDDAPAQWRLFPWCVLIETAVAEVVAALDVDEFSRTRINNATFDAMTDAYTAYADAIAEGAPNDDASETALREFRDELTAHLRAMTKARRAAHKTAAPDSAAG